MSIHDRARAAFLAAVLVGISGCENKSAPIYSPSERFSVRIYDVDEGAAGGDTSVELFWAKGSSQSQVFAGPWKAVEPADIHWIGDSELRINYRASIPADSYKCISTAVVKVACAPK